MRAVVGAGGELPDGAVVGELQQLLRPAGERDVSGLVARLIARDFGGDRRVAVEESTARARCALGVSGWTAWPAAERRAFAQLSLVAALITDLERWPSAERRRLVRVFRAKGCGSERAYANLLDSHRRFRRSLLALVT